VILHYGRRSLISSLIIFALSFTTVRGQKIGLNSCECIKFLNIANIHLLDVWSKRLFICNNNIFFLCFFCLFLLQRNFFLLRLRHQTSATKLHYILHIKSAEKTDDKALVFNLIYLFMSRHEVHSMNTHTQQSAGWSKQTNRT